MTLGFCWRNKIFRGIPDEFEEPFQTGVFFFQRRTLFQGLLKLILNVTGVSCGHDVLGLSKNVGLRLFGEWMEIRINHNVSIYGHEVSHGILPTPFVI